MKLHDKFGRRGRALSDLVPGGRLRQERKPVEAVPCLTQPDGVLIDRRTGIRSPRVRARLGRSVAPRSSRVLRVLLGDP